MAAASVARPSAVHGPALPTTMCSIPSAAAPAQRRTNSSLDSPNLLVTPSSPGRGGGILQRSDVDAGEQPAVRCAYGDERDPEPSGVVSPPDTRLLGQDSDHHRGGPVVVHLRVLHRERTVFQAAAEAAKPLVPGQNETHRAHADETVGEDPPRSPASLRCSAAAQRCARSRTSAALPLPLIG